MLRPTGVVTTVGTAAEAQALRRAAAGRDEFATHKLLVVDARAVAEPLAQQRERMRYRCARYGVGVAELAQLDAAVTPAMVRLVELCMADSAFRLVVVGTQLPSSFVDAVQTIFDRRVVADASPDVWLSMPLVRPAPERLGRSLDLDLLAATVDRGSSAIRAWHAWRARASIDETLGFGEIAPMLAENLRRFGVDVPDLGRVEGVRRRAWYVSQLLDRRATTAVEALALDGIHPVLLGDLPGGRPVRAVELCVRPDAAARASDVLTEQGWTPAFPLTPRRIEQHTWQRFVGGPGLVLFLHWCPLPQGCSRLVPWRDDPTAHLLRLWARTGDPNPGHQLRTVCDTADILERCGDEIDWDRLWSDCARLELVEYGEMYLRALAPFGHARTEPGA